MALNNIANRRLIGQQITGTNLETVQEVVHWMGAMQAQDFEMAKWAVGVRLSGSTEQVVDEAIRKGEIIRTHILRPTWHFVAATDIYWMLELSVPQLKPLVRARLRKLGIPEHAEQKCKSIIEHALTGNNHLTRDEILSMLTSQGLVSERMQATHLMLSCELDGLVCSGEPKGKQQTYALLEERVLRPQPVQREEALYKLADRYFTSHGPATLHDFIWWSGLRISEAKRALEMVKQKLDQMKVDDQTYWFRNTGPEILTDGISTILLPAYDEFIISYRDRSATIRAENHKKAISDNGLFRPVILVNGQAVGSWKRVQQKGKITIETNYFGTVTEPGNVRISIAAKHYGDFLNQETPLLRK